MKKINWVALFLLVLSFSACGTKNNVQHGNADGVYRYYWGEKDGFKVWIVDGQGIRNRIFNEFIYGGNEERYAFVPDGEIWIDNSVSSKEFLTTLEHEINERNLMARLGMTYFDAHDSSLMLELEMRRNYKLLSEKHESMLPLVSPTDFDSTQEIEELPELIKLENIYRVPYGERNGIKIWIVDGFNVRRDIYPDFGFSGNGLAYNFIPEKEIWIDGDITCEETEYSIALELKEREIMSRGIYYDEAYTEAIKTSDNLRNKNRNIIQTKSINLPSVLLRDTGTGKEKTVKN